MDIKETKELIEGVGEVVSVVKKVMADGKVNLEDIKHVVGADHAKIIAAADNAALIKEEIADLSLEEAKELLNLLIDKIAEAKAA